MNTVPNAQPPRTTCQANGMAKAGLVSDPMTLSRVAMPAVPTTTPSMVLQDPIRETIRITAPTRQSSADVSPIEPAMNPRKASIQWVPPT